MARYADGPTVQVTVDIAAAPERVWDLVTDINLPARFSSEFKGAEWVEGNGPALGARFVGYNERKTARWDTTCTVVEFEPLQRFGYAVEDVTNPAATWRFELNPAAGGCRLTMWAQMGPGPSGVSGAISRNPEREAEIIAMRSEEWRHNMTATLDGIQSLAEGNA